MDPGKLVEQVGRYRILEQAQASGGMATVYQRARSEHRARRGDQVPARLAVRGRGLPRAASCARRAPPAGSRTRTSSSSTTSARSRAGPTWRWSCIDGTPLADVLDSGQPLPIRDVVDDRHPARPRARLRARAGASSTATSSPATSCCCATASTIKVTDFGIAHIDDGGEATAHAGRRRARHAALHVARAGARREARRPLGPVLGRHRAVRDAHGPTARSAGDSLVAVVHQHRQARSRPPSDKLRGDLPPSLRRVDRALPGQAARAALPDRRMNCRRRWRKVLIENSTPQAAARTAGRASCRCASKWALIDGDHRGRGDGASRPTVITQRQYAALMDQVMRLRRVAERASWRHRTPLPCWARTGIAVDVVGAGDHEDPGFPWHRRCSTTTGTVRASSQTETVGKAYAAPPAKP
ncbi:MAG: hypothetical protein MZV70_62655 [Desulfobacterales bacterium]|nr:hypothetical protein [Desulfobacterales bacterium]